MEQNHFWDQSIANQSHNKANDNASPSTTAYRNSKNGIISQVTAHHQHSPTYLQTAVMIYTPLARHKRMLLSQSFHIPIPLLRIMSFSQQCLIF